MQLTQTPMRVFVASLSDDDRHAIINSYIELEHNGHTGDSPVRTFSQRFFEGQNSDISLSIIHMSLMAHACYEFFYHATRQHDPQFRE